MSCPLPVIVGFGGYNAAGRSSSFQSYRRTVLESLPTSEQNKTIVGLACLMGLVKKQERYYVTSDGDQLGAAGVEERFRESVLNGTLIRKTALFDPSCVAENRRIVFQQVEPGGVLFSMAKRDLPHQPPADWQITECGEGRVEVRSTQRSEFLVQSNYALISQASGQLPTGFKPSAHYNSRFHPRGLQMALVGSSDALHSTGLAWEVIAARVRPDEVGVYSSSALSQLDEEGFAGLMQSRLRGNRTTAKQLPLGLNSMPADFINAYVLGSVGHTEATTGACATFLYSVQAAVRDISSGRRRVAVVGNAEAGVTPEISEGFANMGALASDANLCKLDGVSEPNYARASRPFGENCGFVLAESTQYVVLMDDALAIELGADIHGAIPDVFINADGIKKSVSAPGVGNYLSFSKAVAAAIQIVGEKAVQNHSFVHAHGSSTPANRTTESTLIERVAQAFDIYEWPVTASKAFVGHSLSAASGDQLISALGTFAYDIVPGIKTIDAVAPDVWQERAVFSLSDLDVSERPMHVAFINSKGFGGNNATALVLSPTRTELMLKSRYGENFTDYLSRRKTTRIAAQAYADRADAGDLDVIYRFGEPLIDETEIVIDRKGVQLPSFAQDVVFDATNPWADMEI